MRSSVRLITFKTTVRKNIASSYRAVVNVLDPERPAVFYLFNRDRNDLRTYVNPMARGRSSKMIFVSTVSNLRILFIRRTA